MLFHNKTEQSVLKDSHALLAKFYPTQNGQIVLRSTTSADLFDSVLAAGDVPRFRTEIFDALDRAMLELRQDGPFAVVIEPPADFVHTAQQFEEIIHMNFRLRLLTLTVAFKANRRKSLWLLLAGCGLLLLSYFCGRLFDGSLIFDVVNILGSLLIWTAGEGYFLDQSANRTLRRRYAHLIEQDDIAPKTAEV